MLNSEALQSAFAKLSSKRGGGVANLYTREEIAALSAWMALELAFEGKLTREDKRGRNRAAWLAGDRTRWGGVRRHRDKRRGWRNFHP